MKKGSIWKVQKVNSLVIQCSDFKVLFAQKQTQGG